MLRLVVVVVVVGCGGSTAPVAQNTTIAAAGPAKPDLSALREMLAPHADHAFDAAANARGCPQGTLGPYLASLVENGLGSSGSQDVHRLSGTCGEFPAAPAAVDPPADPAYWYCVIDSYTSDPAGESPWHYELRLRVRKDTGAPDLTTLGCPGAA